MKTYEFEVVTREIIRTTFKTYEDYREFIGENLCSYEEYVNKIAETNEGFDSFEMESLGLEYVSGTVATTVREVKEV